MKAKSNQRAWDSNDEPHRPYVPKLPTKRRMNLSTEMEKRAIDNRLYNTRTTFIELEAYAARARELEKALNEFVRFAWATGCFPNGKTPEMLVNAAMVSRKRRTIDEVCGKPPGWFERELRAEAKALRRQDARRAKRIRQAIQGKAKR